MAGLGHLLGSSGSSQLRAPSETEQLQGLLAGGQPSQLAAIARGVQMLQQAQDQHAPPRWLTQPLITVPGLSFLLKALGHPQGGDF